MTYELALSYLASLNESRIKPGLERIKEVLTALGSPHSNYPHILVGGTNGKGSVVSFLGTALSAAGYRIGLFTSPHLHKFEERIVVDGQTLTREELVDLVNDVKDVGVEMTYFEYAVAMALLHFARDDVDMAILEVGLGGAWDATNAADPELSVITTVEEDHQEWLGRDLKMIAREKAGIMRSGKPVIVGPVGVDAKNIILQQADAVGAKVVLYGRDFYAYRDSTGCGLHFEGRKWSVKGILPGLKGQFQLDNAACALAALESLLFAGTEISEQDAVRGIESARWTGRLQTIEGSPPIIVDAAHNLAAVRALIISLEKRKDMIWLISALSNKDLRGMAEEMARISNRFVLVPLNHPRSRNILEMEKDMPKGADIKKVSSARQGIVEARKMAGKEGCVVVAGSIVLAGEVLKELGIQNSESRIQESSTFAEASADKGTRSQD